MEIPKNFKHLTSVEGRTEEGLHSGLDKQAVLWQKNLDKPGEMIHKYVYQKAASADKNRQGLDHLFRLETTALYFF